MVEPLCRVGDTGVEGEGILCHFYESFSCCIEEISVSVDHISEKLDLIAFLFKGSNHLL